MLPDLIVIFLFATILGMVGVQFGRYTQQRIIQTVQRCRQDFLPSPENSILKNNPRMRRETAAFIYEKQRQRRLQELRELQQEG